jgi:hypothetical protein
MAETSNISRVMLWNLAHGLDVTPEGDLDDQAFDDLVNKGFVAQVAGAGPGTFSVGPIHYAVTAQGQEKVYRTLYRELDRYKRLANIESTQVTAQQTKKSAGKATPASRVVQDENNDGAQDQPNIETGLENLKPAEASVSKTSQTQNKEEASGKTAGSAKKS